MKEGQLGALVVSLQADVARFREDLGKANKSAQDSAQSISKNFDSIGSAVTKTAGLMAGLAGVASLGTLAKSSIDAADQMSKMSQKVGVAIGQLSGMAYAASLADVSTEQLGKGMGKLAKLMYEAAGDQKGGPAETFKSLGVAVTDATGKLRGTDEVMMDIAERFSGMKDGAAKTALAMEVFGKSGADLIPLLNSGEQGLKEAADEARRFGLVLTEEAGKQAEEFNDNLTRLKARAEGAAITIANALLPEMNKLIDKFAKGGDIADSPLMQGINSIKAEFLRLAMLADKAGGSLSAAGMLLYGPGSALGVKSSEERFKRMADFNIMFEGRYQESEKALQTMANLEVGLDAEGNPIKPKTNKSGGGSGLGDKGKAGTIKAKADNFTTDSPGFMNWRREAELVKEESVWLAAAIAAAAQESSDIYQLILQEDAAAAQEASDIYQMILQEQNAAAQQAKDFKQIMVASDLDQLTLDYENRMAEVQKWNDVEIDAAERKAAALLKIEQDYAADKAALNRDSWMMIGDITANQLGQMAGMMDQTNKKQFEAYKAMMMVQATIATAMSIVGILAAESKLGMFAIPLAFSAGAIGAAQVAMIASQEYPGRATGGPVASGSTYLVGEKGPELFTPGASGMITPNNALGGQTVEVTNVFQVSTGVSDTVRAEIAGMIPAFTKMSVNAVKQAMRSGEFQGVRA